MLMNVKGKPELLPCFIFHCSCRKPFFKGIDSFSQFESWHCQFHNEVIIPADVTDGAEFPVFYVVLGLDVQKRILSSYRKL